MLTFDLRGFWLMNPLAMNKLKSAPGCRRALVLIGLALLLCAPPASAQLSFNATDYTFRLAARTGLADTFHLGAVTASGANTFTYSLISNPTGKFSIAAANGALHYIGGVREDVTDTPSYALTVRATTGVLSIDTDVTVLIGICDRTSAAYNLISDAAGFVSIDDAAQNNDIPCHRITLELLNETEDNGNFGLNFMRDSGAPPFSLAAGDFDGLPLVKEIYAAGDDLEGIAAGALDGLSNLRFLILSNTSLTGAGLSPAAFSGLSTLESLNLSGSTLDVLPSGIFAGLSTLVHLDLTDTPGAPFAIDLSLAQLADAADGSGSPRFEVRSSVAGPAATVTYRLSGGGAGVADVTASVLLPAGATRSSPFATSFAHPTVTLTGVTFPAIIYTDDTGYTGFEGFTAAFAATSLTINAPRFTEPQGYTFAVAPDSASGDVIGTVTAIVPNDSSAVITYALSAAANVPFTIDSAGVISSSSGTGNETPGTSVVLSVTATNEGNKLSAGASVTVLVSGLKFTASGPFTLPATAGPAAVVVGALVATDAFSIDPIRYTLLSVNDAAGALANDTFAVDESSGEVRYVGSGGEDVTLNASYALTVRATTTGTAATEATVLVSVGICDRTPQVAVAIATLATGAAACQNVSAQELAGVSGTFDLSDSANMLNITALQPGDFAGLGSLTTLNMQGSSLLSVLPAGVFSGLSSLTDLYLAAPLDNLTAGVLSDLSSLTAFLLNSTQLDALPAGMFAGLSTLEFINLGSNTQLSSVPPGLFGGLSKLTSLYLVNNRFSSVPDGLFDGLSSLTTLDLRDSPNLSSLPAGVFDGLSALSTLRLNGSGVAPYAINYGIVQVADDNGAPAFAIRSDFAGPPAAVSYSLSGGGAGAMTGSITLSAGTTSVSFSGTSGYTEVTLTGVTIPGLTVVAGLDAGFDGFTANFAAAPLTIDAPRFTEPQGYTFAVASSSASGALIGTVTAMDPTGSNVVITYTLSAAANAPFTLDSTGVIRSSAALSPATTYTLGVTASNAAGNLTTGVAVTVAVSGVRFSATASGPFALPTTAGTAAVVVGTLGAIEALGDPIRYTLLDVIDAAGADASNKLAVDATSGEVRYVGSGTEDTTVNASYALTVRAEVAANASTNTGPASASATVLVNVGICDRTPQVANGIVTLVGAADCGNVSTQDLADAAGTLNLANINNMLNITALQPFDFAGLSKLTVLDLNSNPLSVLPAGIFDGLSSLQSLILSVTSIADLQEDVFADLTGLFGMFLRSMQLQRLPPNIFAGLNKLLNLQLSGNPGAPFAINYGVVQLANDNGTPAFAIRSDFAGPAVAVDYQLSGSAAGTMTDSVTLLGGTTSVSFSGASGHTSVTLTAVSFAGENSDGIDLRFAAAPLTIGAPRFTEPQGYTFAVASSSASGDVIGTVTAIDPGGSAVITYALSAAATAPFTIDSTGVISSSAALAPAATYTLGVTATNTVNNSTTGVAVTVVVSGVRFTASGPFALPATAGSAAVVLGTVVAVDAFGNDPVSYALLTATDTAGDPASDTFTVDATSGEVRYASSGTEDATVNASYALTVRAEVSANASTNTGASAIATIVVNVGICDRTPLVATAIVTLVGAAACQNVSAQELAGATATDSLNFFNVTIPALQPWDFAGLSNLGSLYLSNVSLSALPAGVFADLRKATFINLQFNALSTLPAGVFAGLTNLLILYLDENQLNSVPADVFADLSSLQELELDSNSLNSVPPDVFAGLSSLQQLRLSDNPLSSLPAGVFAGLSSLEQLRLQRTLLSSVPDTVFGGLSSLELLHLSGNNKLSSLPDGVFADLSRLTSLNLQSNQLSSLPDGVFGGLSSLTELQLLVNPGAPFAINYGVVQVANSAAETPTFAIRSDFAGPAAAVSYQLSGSAAGAMTGNVTLPAGTTSVSFSGTSGHTSVTLTAVSFVGTNIDGFTANFAAIPLTIGAPRFTEPQGYTFAVASSSASGALIGTVTAMDPNDSNVVITYTLSAATTAPFTLDSTGVIRSSAALSPATTYTLGVTATNDTNSSLTTGVAVTVAVSGVRFSATASGPFALPTTAGTAAVVVGTLGAIEALGDPIRYTLLDVIDAAGADASNKLAVDESSGEVRYVGSGTEDVTVNASYALTVRAEVAANASTGLASASATVLVVVNVGICDRTPQVANGIATLVGAAACGNVSAQALADATGSLDLRNQSITALQPWDFAGLSGLLDLFLSNSDGSSADEKNRFSSLPDGIFADLSSLQELVLDNNSLNSVPPDVFGGLSSLQRLRLSDNPLSSVPAGVFAGLSSVQELRLERNQLSSVPDAVFGGLSNLEVLNLSNNQLSSLPDGVFADLSSLTSLNLQLNQLNRLPDGVFGGLSSLTALELFGNPGAPFAINYGVVQVVNSAAGTPTFAIRSDFAGPAAAVSYQLSGSAAGTMADSVTLPSGTTGVSFGASGHTNVTLTAVSFVGTDINGFTANFAAASLVVGAPRFTEPLYVFEIAPSNASGDVIGTVTAMDPNDDNALITYTLSATTPPFTIDNTGVIRYSGAGNEIPGTSTALSVTATNATDQTTGVAVTIGVNGVRFTSTTAFALPATAGSAAVVLGTVVAVDAFGNDPVSYTLLTATDTAGDPASDTFTVDATSGEVRYVGSGGEDVTLNARYTLMVRADIAANPSTGPASAIETVVVNVGICDRTPQVVTAIATLVGAADCATVSAQELAGAAVQLSLANGNLTALRPWDFAGLSSLTKLRLADNRSLGALPAGVFDGLISLTGLYLQRTAISELPENVFADLVSVTEIDITDADLNTLPAEVFAGLGNLTNLYLSGSNPGAPFAINYMAVQLMNASDGLSMFEISSDFAGPAATVEIEFSGAGVANVTASVILAAGTTSNSPYGISDDYTTVSINSVAFHGTVAGLEPRFAPPLALGTPFFSQPLYTFTLAEEQAGPRMIGTISATDPTADTIAYAISGAAASRFSIDATSGVLSYIGSGEDFESTTSYTLTVQASDSGGLTSAAELSIIISDVAGTMFIGAPYTFNLDENVPGPFVLGNVTATDIDRGAITYSLSVSPDSDRFRVDASSGELNYIGSGEDFEARSAAYTLNVQAEDGNALTDAAEVIVTIGDITEKPVFIDAPYTFNLDENVPGPRVLGSISVEDAMIAVSFALIADANNRFSIDATNGAFSYSGSGEDFESSTTSYTLTVVATDAEARTESAMVTVTVNNVGEGPVFVQTTYLFSMNELQSGAQTAIALGTVTASDPDNGGAVMSYGLAIGDPARFSVGTDSGALSYVGNGEDFDANPSFTLSLQATDNTNLAAAATVTITINDITTARSEMAGKVLAQVSSNIANNAANVFSAQLGGGGGSGGVSGTGLQLQISGYALDKRQYSHLTRWMKGDYWRSTGGWNGKERAFSLTDLGLDLNQLDGKWKQFKNKLWSNSSFQLSLGATEGKPRNGLEGWSVWGRGSISGDLRIEDGIRSGGKSRTGFLGLDYQANDSLLLGVALSHSRSDGYSEMVADGANRTDIESTLNAAFPYLRWSPLEGYHIWGALGHGSGEVEIKDANGAVETDIEMNALAFGTERHLTLVGKTQLAFKADGFVVHLKSDERLGLDATDSQSRRLRASFSLNRVQRWSPHRNTHLFGGIEMGARIDGGDVLHGQGLDMSANVGFNNPDMGLEAKSLARILVAHTRDYNDWGLDVTLRFKQPAQPQGRGLTLTLKPGWGQTADNIDSLWKSGISSLSRSTTARRSMIPDRTQFLLRYGLYHGGALWSPFAEAGMKQDALGVLKLGLQVDATRLRVSLSGDQDRVIGIKAVLGF